MSDAATWVSPASEGLYRCILSSARRRNPHTGEPWGFCIAFIKTLAKWRGVTQRWIYKMLAELEAAGWIERVPEPGVRVIIRPLLLRVPGRSIGPSRPFKKPLKTSVSPPPCSGVSSGVKPPVPSRREGSENGMGLKEQQQAPAVKPRQPLTPEQVAAARDLEASGVFPHFARRWARQSVEVCRAAIRKAEERRRRGVDIETLGAYIGGIIRSTLSGFGSLSTEEERVSAAAEREARRKRAVDARVVRNPESHSAQKSAAPPPSPVEAAWEEASEGERASLLADALAFELKMVKIPSLKTALVRDGFTAPTVVARAKKQLAARLQEKGDAA